MSSLSIRSLEKANITHTEYPVVMLPLVVVRYRLNWPCCSSLPEEISGCTPQIHRVLDISQGYLGEPFLFHPKKKKQNDHDLDKYEIKPEMMTEIVQGNSLNMAQVSALVVIVCRGH